jgi:hypothetical protein
VLLKYHALRVVAQHARVDEAAQVELLGAELGHGDKKMRKKKSVRSSGPVEDDSFRVCGGFENGFMRAFATLK